MYMTTEGFEAIVSVSGNVSSEQVAIAEASCYLGCYIGDVFEVNVYGGPDAGSDEGETNDWGVALQFNSQVVDSEKVCDRFMDRIANLPRVETVERVPYTQEK